MICDGLLCRVEYDAGGADTARRTTRVALRLIDVWGLCL